MKIKRALPVAGANADMKTFTPDSSIVSDVIPSMNHGERNNGRIADMIVLHYTGMPDAEGAIAQLCTAGTDVSAISTGSASRTRSLLTRSSSSPRVASP